MTGRLSTSAWWKSSPYVLLQRLVDRAAADLLDPEVRVGRLDRRRRVEQRLHACQRPRPASPVISTPDQHGRAAGSRDRRGHARHLGQAAQPAGRLGRGRGRRGPVKRPGSGGDQDVLHRRVGEVGVGEHLLGPAPLAHRLLRVGLLRVPAMPPAATQIATNSDPSQHRPPAVLRAPPRDPYHPARAPVHHCRRPSASDLRVDVEPVDGAGLSQDGDPRLLVGLSAPRRGRAAGSAMSVPIPTRGGRTGEPMGGDEVTVEPGATEAGQVELTAAQSSPGAAPGAAPSAAPATTVASAPAAPSVGGSTMAAAEVRRPTGADRLVDDAQHPHRAVDRAALVRLPGLAAAGLAGAHAGLPGRTAAVGVRAAAVPLVRRDRAWALPDGARRRHPVAAPGREAGRQPDRPVPPLLRTPARGARPATACCAFRLSAVQVVLVARPSGCCPSAGCRCRSTTGRCRTAAPTSRCSRSAAGGHSPWCSWSACCC